MKTVTIPMITATVGGLACAGLGLATGPRARAAQAAILQVSLGRAEVDTQAPIRGRHRRRLTETAMPRQDDG